MTVVALCSAKHSPGVSTCALAMTLLWPRAALLAECDPAGGDVLAGFFAGTVQADRGVLALASAHRAGELEAQWPAQTVALDAGGGRGVIPGISDPAQAAGMLPLWGELAALFADLGARRGVDVLIDAGRLGAEHFPAAVLRGADVVLLVLRSDLPAVTAARGRVAVLREQLGAGADGRLGLLVVGPAMPYKTARIEAGLGVPVLASVAWDPASASALSVGADRGRRFAVSPLVRSTRAAIDAVGLWASQQAVEVGAPPAPRSRENSGV